MESAPGLSEFIVVNRPYDQRCYAVMAWTTPRTNKYRGYTRARASAPYPPRNTDGWRTSRGRPIKKRFNYLSGRMHTPPPPPPPRVLRPQQQSISRVHAYICVDRTPRNRHRHRGDAQYKYTRPAHGSIIIIIIIMSIIFYNEKTTAADHPTTIYPTPSGLMGKSYFHRAPPPPFESIRSTV